MSTDLLNPSLFKIIDSGYNECKIMEKRGVFMIQYIYNNNIIIYTFVALCGLGVVFRIILELVYIYLVKESDKLGDTKNKLLKHMRMKFETCYKLNIGVNNVDTFVDKSLTKYRFCGILLSTWENLSGQVLLVSFLIVPISGIFGVVFEISPDLILYTGAVGILAGAALILVDKMTNLPVKKQMIRLNLLDYLENFCKVRLEQEAAQPEKIEKYRQEYLNTVGSKIENDKTETENKEEINRRMESKKRKEEKKRLQAIKREEELKKIEERQKEAELIRLEEIKKRQARRKEEELQKLQEEKEALELRREELRRKVEKKLQQNEMKQRKKEEKEKILNSIEEEIHSTKAKEEKQIDESIEETAAVLEEPKSINKEQEQQIQLIQAEMSPEEEKVVEDVLRKFFV